MLFNFPIPIAAVLIQEYRVVDQENIFECTGAVDTSTTLQTPFCMPRNCVSKSAYFFQWDTDCCTKCCCHRSVAISELAR